MAFFKKKSDAGDEIEGKLRGKRGRRGEDAASADEPYEPEGRAKHAGKAPKKRKRNETMASVLRESVVDQALAELKANPDFTIERRGQTYHVGWLLAAEDIGGLSKKTNRDEDKGGIIECINSGRIKVLITPALMDEDKLVVIPDPPTLDAMSEFSILTHAPYRTMFVATDGSQIDDDGGADVSFADAEAVSKHETSIGALLSERGSIWGTEAAPDVPSSPIYGRTSDDFDDDDDIEVFDDTAVDGAVADATPTQAMPPVGADLSAYGDASFEFDDDDIDIDEQSSFGRDIAWQAQGSQMGREAAPEAEVAEAVAEPEPEPEPVEEVSPEEFEEAARRRFFSDDLGLGIDYDAFDAQFSAKMPFSPFPTDRPEGFLGDYMNQMSAEANADLETMHKRHMAILRERYTRMMASYTARVEDMHRMDDGANNEYKDRERAAMLLRNEQQQEAAATSAVRISELKDNYENRKRTAMDAAAARAGEQYDTRHGRELDQQCAKVETLMRGEAQDAYNATMRDVNRARREHAAKSMDYGTTAILASLSSMYADMLDLEHARYEEHRATMQAWMEENRRNDVVWSQTMAEDLRQSEKADAVAAEFADRMRQQQMDFEQRKAALEAEMSEMRTRHDMAMSEAQSRQEQLLGDMRAENQRLKEREGELLDRYSSLDADKAREYDTRIRSLERELEEKDRRYSELANRDKRSNVLWIALSVVFAIAALCVGMIFGLHQSIDYQVGAAKGAVIMADVMDTLLL